MTSGNHRKKIYAYIEREFGVDITQPQHVYLRHLLKMMVQEEIQEHKLTIRAQEKALHKLEKTFRLYKEAIEKIKEMV